MYHRQTEIGQDSLADWFFASGVIYFAGLLVEGLLLAIYIRRRMHIIGRSRSSRRQALWKRTIATQLLLMASTLLRAVWFIIGNHGRSHDFHSKHAGSTTSLALSRSSQLLFFTAFTVLYSLLRMSMRELLMNEACQAIMRT